MCAQTSYDDQTARLRFKRGTIIQVWTPIGPTIKMSHHEQQGSPNRYDIPLPIQSMGLVYLPMFGGLWWIFMVNLGKYTIHGFYGIY